MFNIAPWHDVLIAAAATLAGLILAAMSVNIDAILKYASLPSRAGSAIGSLVYVLVLTVAALIPGVTATELGWLTLLVLLGPVAIYVDVRFARFRFGRGRASAGCGASSPSRPSRWRRLSSAASCFFGAHRWVSTG